LSTNCKNRILVICLSFFALSVSFYSCFTASEAYFVRETVKVMSELEANRKQEIVPTVITTEIKNNAGTTASGGGYITDEGTSPILSRGVCWGPGPAPTTTGNKTTDGAGVGSFFSTLTGLNGATDYFVRAYATNNEGTGYGEAKFFTTAGQLPTAKALAATDINTTIATLNGSVNANYISTVVFFEYGTTKRYGNTASAAQSPIAGNTATNVSANISELTMGTVYHYRIKATNSLGTTYSRDMTFKTNFPR
jgi:hypothetical protein